MKKVILWLIVVFLVYLYVLGNSYAANTIIWGEDTIEISAIDSDWTWNETGSGSPYTGNSRGIKVDYIIFVPGAAADDLSLLEEDANGGELFPNFEVPTLQGYMIYFFGGKVIKPFLDYSESTLSSGSKVIIGLYGN